VILPHVTDAERSSNQYLQIRETVLGKDIEIGTLTISKCKSGRDEDIHDLISALSNPDVKQWVLLIFQESIDGCPE
jgi:hypothetical protein